MLIAYIFFMLTIAGSFHFLSGFLSVLGVVTGIGGAVWVLVAYLGLMIRQPLIVVARAQEIVARAQSTLCEAASLQTEVLTERRKQ